MILFDAFVLMTLAASLGVVLAAAPLGCFVVWQRIAYFGDAISHAAILGVGLALTFQFSVLLGVLIIALATAFAISWPGQRLVATDTLLGVIATSSLALGMVLISLSGAPSTAITGYLFGDILGVTLGDVGFIWLAALTIIGTIYLRWSKLLVATASDDLAFASGVDPRREKMLLAIGLALLVAMGIKLVGALLIVAMLIIPAASARGLSHSPEAMVKTACFFGALASVIGLLFSLYADAPMGPSIVVAAMLIFVSVSTITKSRMRS